MLPASNRGAGMNLASPDVCNTPTPGGPVPIPYPNVALNAQAQQFSRGVKICMMNALNLGSKIPMSSGDEPGTAHPTIKGQSTYTMGSPNVNIDGLPAITLTCPTTGNRMNAVGAVLVPSLVNVFFSYLAPGGDAAAPPAEGDPYTRAVSEDDLTTLHDALHAPVASAVRGAMLPAQVGHVAVAHFSGEVPTLVYNEIQRLEALGMRALVLDLRGNPGGDAQASLQLASEFLGRGAVLAIAVDADGDELLHRASDDGAYRMPAVVLVDRGTASAAELLAGCLKAHGRAAVVGERTHGKGLAQRLTPSSDGPGALLATCARYRLPDGGEIEGVGIRPDVVVTGATRAVTGDEALRVAWQTAQSRRA